MLFSSIADGEWNYSPIIRLCCNYMPMNLYQGELASKKPDCKDCLRWRMKGALRNGQRSRRG